MGINKLWCILRICICNSGACCPCCVSEYAASDSSQMRTASHTFRIQMASLPNEFVGAWSNSKLDWKPVCIQDDHICRAFACRALEHAFAAMSIRWSFGHIRYYMFKIEVYVEIKNGSHMLIKSMKMNLILKPILLDVAIRNKSTQLPDQKSFAGESWSRIMNLQKKLEINEAKSKKVLTTMISSAIVRLLIIQPSYNHASRLTIWMAYWAHASSDAPSILSCY